LKDGEEAPQWVMDLINSGMLTEVHKFSKFVHGCAVLLTEEIRFAPYWIDDASIRASVLRSQHIDVQKRVGGGGSDVAPPVQPMQKIYESGLLGEETIDLMNSQASFDRSSPYTGPARKGGANNQRNYGSMSGAAINPAQHEQYGASVDHGLLVPHDEEHDHTLGHGGGVFQSCLQCCGLGGARDVEGGAGAYQLIPRRTPMKIEPKVFFANERTLLSWLHMAITLGSIAAGLLGVSVHSMVPSKGSAKAIAAPSDVLNAPEIIGMLLLPVAILFAVYAIFTFHWRGRLIHERIPGKLLNDTFGPTVLASILIAALSAVFLLFLFGDVAVKI
jgi:uncharacterized membrane protein YidH (DUF202 family)